MSLYYENHVVNVTVFMEHSCTDGRIVYLALALILFLSPTLPLVLALISLRAFYPPQDFCVLPLAHEIYGCHF